MKFSSILFIQSFAILAMSQQIPLATSLATPPHHHHHLHHKHHIEPTGVIQEQPYITEMAKRDDETDLPTVSAMPTLTTTTQYNAVVEVPTVKNPYITSSNLPDGIVFIIVGGIIGLIFISFISYRIIAWIISNRKAKHEKEHYYHNFNNSNSIFGSNGSNGLSSSSNSSMFEKNSSFVSNSSFYQLSRTNSLAQLDEMITTSSNPGRAYRDTVSGSIYNNGSGLNLSNSKLANNRGSMFISPILETISGRRSLSQLELPLYNQQQPSQEQLDQMHALTVGGAGSDNNSNILSPYTIKPVESSDSIPLNDFDYLEAERLLMNNNNSDIESQDQQPSPQANHPYRSESHYYAQLLNNQHSHSHSHSQSQINLATNTNNTNSGTTTTTTTTTKSRPPSVYLDALLDDE
ncbi:hypothetical protein DFJ63DRAFT_81923 [Scheffersomyces coipomensis]|uniref:uncharacterized protein n=1 Tax=Scheffersomyces coipomensis TaxID=1788519 RepID=UPI00315DDF2E